jgi:hypothetical protein
MRRQYSLFGVAALVLFATTNVGIAKNMTVSISMNKVTAKTGEDGNYYVINFDLPVELSGKRLDSAFLEFVVDATPTDAMSGAQAPIVAVFPLTDAFTGSNLAFKRDVPTLQAADIDGDHVLRSDITDIVKGWMASPSSNHGLVIGTLVGPRVGTVTLKESALGAGAALRVTYFYQNRFGERVSTR